MKLRTASFVVVAAILGGCGGGDVCVGGGGAVGAGELNNCIEAIVVCDVRHIISCNFPGDRLR